MITNPAIESIRTRPLAPKYPVGTVEIINVEYPKALRAGTPFWVTITFAYDFSNTDKEARLFAQIDISKLKANNPPPRSFTETNAAAQSEVKRDFALRGKGVERAKLYVYTPTERDWFPDSPAFRFSARIRYFSYSEVVFNEQRRSFRIDNIK